MFAPFLHIQQPPIVLVVKKNGFIHKLIGLQAVFQRVIHITGGLSCFNELGSGHNQMCCCLRRFQSRPRGHEEPPANTPSG